MKYNNNILGLILARSGSKGIKQKNISKLCGKPLIAWTINSALKSKRLTDVILSTDSTTIAKIGKKFGADVPFIRPLKFSKDKSPSIDAIEHAIKWLRKNGTTTWLESAVSAIQSAGRQMKKFLILCSDIAIDTS